MKTGARSYLKTIKPATFFAAILGLGSCGPRSVQLPISEVKHTLDQPTITTHPSMWMEVNDEQYRSVLLATIGADKTVILPNDDVITKRMQFWLDEFDQTIRQAHPEQLAHVPKPKAKVLATQGTNAFVIGIPVCYSFKLDLSSLNSGSATAANTTKTILINPKNGALSPYPEDKPCIDGGANSQNVEAILAHFNAHSAECQIQLKNDRITATQACVDKSSNLKNLRYSDKIIIPTTANTITILSGIISKLKEYELAAVLAHELGHYYRTHASAPASLYDFFYTSGRKNHSEKPQPEPSLKEMGEKTVAAVKNLKNLDKFFRVPGQKINSEMFAASVSLVRDTCDSGECIEACTKVKDYIDQPEYLNPLYGFPYQESLSEKQKDGREEAYLNFEANILTCLESVPFTAMASDQTSPKAISWDHIKNTIKSPKKAPWWNLKGRIDIYDDFPALLKRAQGASTDGINNVAQMILAASQQVDKADSLVINVLKEAQNLSLGYYTAEQEADDLAVEWMSKIGLNPKYATEAMRALYGSEAKGSVGGFDYSAAACSKLYAKNWLDENGNYAFVSVGDYTAKHHSMCYRMFNMDREIEAHGLTPAPRSQDLSPGATSWTEIQKKAAEDAKKFWGGIKNVLSNSEISSYLSNCPYAETY